MAALATRWTLAGGGGLAHKLLSLARPAATAQFRSVFTFRYYNLMEGAREVCATGITKVPDKTKKKVRTADGGRGDFELWEDAEGLHGRYDMQGLDKEHIKIWVEGEVVIIHGEGPERKSEKDFDREDIAIGRKYDGIIQARPGFKLSEIQAKMKNGVLTVLVPAPEKNAAM